MFAVDVFPSPCGRVKYSSLFRLEDCVGVLDAFCNVMFFSVIYANVGSKTCFIRNFTTISVNLEVTDRVMFVFLKGLGVQLILSLW